MVNTRFYAMFMTTNSHVTWCTVYKANDNLKGYLFFMKLSFAHHVRLTTALNKSRDHISFQILRKSNIYYTNVIQHCQQFTRSKLPIIFGKII